MSYRTILVPIGQRENAESAIEAAFRVAKRFSGHVHGLHVLPDLAAPATHALIATRMTTEEASSDLQKYRTAAEREVKRQATELRRLFEKAVGQAGAPLQDVPEHRTGPRPPGRRSRLRERAGRQTGPDFRPHGDRYRARACRGSAVTAGATP